MVGDGVPCQLVKEAYIVGADDLLARKTGGRGYFRQDIGDGQEKAMVTRVNAEPLGGL